MREDDSSLLAVGARVDTYEIIGHLGRGGFGITYKVFDPGLGKDFALKEFFPADLVTREGSSVRIMSKGRAEADYQWGRRKFFDEARLLAQLNHPNIVKVQRVFEANNTAYMLLDFVPGSTLEQWLGKIQGSPTQDELDLVAGPLLDALEVVHGNRTCHLDIAPDNILIRSSDGAPIVLDFGAARLEIKQRSQLVSAMLFKSGYSAPEQYTSSAERLGPWTDIYAIAATLYRAISGERPIEATSRTLRDDLVPAAKLGKGRYRDSFLRAIDQALRIPLAQRPQTIVQWRRDLMNKEPISLGRTISDIQSGAADKLGEVADLARKHAPAFVTDGRVSKFVRPIKLGAERVLDRISDRTSLSRGRVMGVAAAILAVVVLPTGYLLSPKKSAEALPPLGQPNPVSPNADAKADRPLTVVPTLLPPAIEQSPPSSRPGSFVRVSATLGIPLPAQRFGWLGMRATPVSSALAKTLGLLNTKGVFVQDAAPEGGFASAGGRTGDIVLRVDGKEVNDPAELRRLVQAKQPGNVAVLDVWRFGPETQSFKDLMFDLSQRGDAHAMYWMGMYTLGTTIVPRNDTEALAWFRKSEDAGDTEAGFRWGSMVAEGRGTRKNPWEAQRILIAAGRGGSVDAFVRLAKLMPEMRRGTADLKRAADMLRLAAESNNTTAMVTLGDWHTSGYAGVQRDPGEAVRQYRRAAELGEPTGLTSIAVLHLSGNGVAKDDAQAVEVARQAAAQGDLLALRLLAYLYDNGLGVPQRNPDLAGEMMYAAIASGLDIAYSDMQQAATKSSIEFRTAIQKRLREGGFYFGEVNGEFTQPTMAALKALYERRPRVPSNM